MNERAKIILDFWFIETTQEDHFKKNDEFDNIIYQKFIDDYEKAANNEYEEWINDARTCLALIIILDQFSRNLFRNDRKSYQLDNKARLILNEAINKNYLDQLSITEKHYMLLPLLHSEDIKDHIQAQKLLKTHLKNHPRYQDVKKAWDRHTYIIKRFRRYPHRNNILGRKTTNDEEKFLATPNSSF